MRDDRRALVSSLASGLKTALAGAFATTGLLALVGHMRRATTGPRVHVLGYHRVTDVVDRSGSVNAVNPALCISVESFRRQMMQVKERFEVLSLPEVMDVLSGRRPLGRDACAITFDDGYADVWLRAAPVLDELGLPATVFVPSGYVGSSEPLVHDRLYAGFWRHLRRVHPPRLGLEALSDDAASLFLAAELTARTRGPAAAGELLIARLPDRDLRHAVSILEAVHGAPELDPGSRVLRPDELRQLADAGWEIGAHTVGHVVLTHEPPARVAEELARPRVELSAITGHPCRYFAYCNGMWTPSLVEAVRRAGYEGAVTTFDRVNRPGRTSPFHVGRKCLWEAHTRGADGRWSASVSAAHLHDLFGDLGLTTPVEGCVVEPQLALAARSAEPATPPSPASEEPL